MAQTVDNTLEGRIAQLESAVRSLRTANWTERASVVDATGQSVPLSSLAFGQVAAVVTGVGVANIKGVAGQPSPSTWTYADPTVTVLVRGGRMRVDWAALMAHAGGSAAASAYWAFSYVVDFTGPPEAPGTVLTRTVNPDYYRAIMLRDTSLTIAYMEAGNWYMHTGLAPGWYRVRAAWMLGYAATAGTQPEGWADNPRLAVTPF